MNKRDFVRQREPAWNRFESLLNHFRGRSLGKVRSREVTEFSRLFRELANDLAIVRSRGWGEQLAAYLNDLVSRGYDAFYVAEPGYLRRAGTFLTAEFPQLLRANGWYFIVSCVLFFVPLGIAWAVVQNNPSLAKRVVPEAQLDMFERAYANRENSRSASRQDAEADRVRRAQYREGRSLMAGFYVQHNTSIAFHSFARGVLLGIGTVYTLLFNGILLGTVAGYVVAEANAEMFLSFVVTHGAFELTAIAVSGAGGLMLGNALLHPGQRTRWDALTVRGLEAIKLAIGAGVMLFIAALIEAFWSPAPIPAMLKYVVGAMAWMVVALYFLFAGRTRAASPESTKESEVMSEE